MSDSILVKILNSKPITLTKVASSSPKRRKNHGNCHESVDDNIGKIVRIENLSLTTSSTKKMTTMTTTTIKCHRDSLESNNCDEGDDSGTEPWSGSCSSDSLSENSDCHVDQNDSGCDDYMFHEDCDREYDLVLIAGEDNECPQHRFYSCNVDHREHANVDDGEFIDAIAKGNNQNSNSDSTNSCDVSFSFSLLLFLLTKKFWNFSVWIKWVANKRKKMKKIFVHWRFIEPSAEQSHSLLCFCSLTLLHSSPSAHTNEQTTTNSRVQLDS